MIDSIAGAFAEMHGADWVLIFMTFLACCIGSALGAGITNWHTRKLDREQLNRREAELRDAKAQERLNALTKIIHAYDGIFRKTDFKAIEKDLAKRLEDETYRPDIDYLEQFENATHPLVEETLLHIDCTEDNPNKDELSKDFLRLNMYIDFVCTVGSVKHWMSHAIAAADSEAQRREAILNDFRKYSFELWKCYFNLSQDIFIRHQIELDRNLV